MKATGIVRRIDELGRVGIPKEIRRTLRIREGDPLEIFTENDGGIVLKKYSPIGELSTYANELAAVLQGQFGMNAAICDRDHFVAVAMSGGKKRDLAEKRISEELERAIAQRRALSQSIMQGPVMTLTSDNSDRDVWTFVLAVPIISESESIGAVLLFTQENAGLKDNAAVKTAEAIAALIGKILEQ